MTHPPATSSTGQRIALLLLVTLAASVVLYGCSGPQGSAGFSEENADRTATGQSDAAGDDSSGGERSNSTSNIQAHDVPPGTVIDARPAALINGRQITWGDLKPILTEAAGGLALREVILSQLLERQMNLAGLTVTEDDIQGERRLLLQSLSDDSETSLRMLQQLRQRQGLGDRRFRGLLRRNAQMRMLVSDNVEVNPQHVEQMFQRLHGPRRQARIITVPDLASAQKAIHRIDLGEFFADVAVEVSTDSSAARGGLLEPISEFDASYPRTLRRKLWSMEVGEVSNSMLVDDQFVIIKLVREIPGDDDVTFEDVRDEMRQLVQRQQERILMDQLYRRMMNDVSVTIFDPALRESWQRQSDSSRGIGR